MCVCVCVLCSTHQLIKVDPRRSTYLACGLFVRGDVMISDVQRNIERVKKDINMVYWNEEGFKVGLCTVPPISQGGGGKGDGGPWESSLSVSGCKIFATNAVVDTCLCWQPYALLCLANNCAVRYPLR